MVSESRSRRGAGVAASLLLAFSAWLLALLFAPVGGASAQAQDMRASAASGGYLLADTAGVVTAFGDATARGGLDGATLRAPIVDGDMTPTGLGYVLVGADGGVFSFGDAPFLGGLGSTRLAAPIVGIDVTPTGKGYILVAADGGVFSFGDAPFKGSMGGIRLNAPIVDIGLVPGNDGYRLSASDGGVFAFGNASFDGSMGGRPLNEPVTGLIAQKDGPGYALVAADGGFFAFGGFVFRGSLGSITLGAPIVDAVLSPTGLGYNLVGSDGGVFAFGDAPYRGSAGGTTLPRPIVTVLGLTNETPDAKDDAFAATEDTPLTGAAPGVLANDTDGDGDTLTASPATGPAHGTLSLRADGAFTYTPTADYSGPDSFTYKVADGYGGTDVATATLSVAPVNDVPVAGDDAYATDEDVPLAVAAPGVLANDADAETASPTPVLVTGPTKGTLTLGSDGSFTYTPHLNTSGADSFTYKADDGTAESNVATVSLTVNARNDAPVAVDDARTTNEEAALNVAAPGVLGNDSDVEGSPLAAALVTGPANGTLTLNADGSFTYVPNTDFAGGDSFTYKAGDGTADSNVATVSITVNGVNDPPVAVDDAHSTNEDTTLPLAAPGVLGNDRDVDGNPLTAVLVTGPSRGTLTLLGNGSFTYTPDPDVNGADSFTYKATDGSTDSNIATVNLMVNAVNDPPIADDDSYTANEDTTLVVSSPGVLAGDSDVDGGALSVALLDDVDHGTLALSPDGSFTYAPDPDTNGEDGFTYTVSDGNGGTDVGAVTLTVGAVNDSPVADNDSHSVDEDAVLTQAAPGVLDGDTDAENGTLTATLVDGVDHGALTLNPDGSFTYTPTPDYNGADAFTYKANDGTADSNVATVNITVNGVNDPPVAHDDSYRTVQDTSRNVASPGVLGNDTDVDAGTNKTATKTSNPTNGTVTLNSDGSFVYTPLAAFTGTDSFTYDVSDGTATDGGLVTITVVPPNSAPTADDTTAAGNEDTAGIVVALTGRDADDHNLTFTVETAENGLVTVPGAVDCSAVNVCTTTVTYTPNGNFNGTDSFTYKVTDQLAAESGNATATITVNAVNDVPSFTKGGNQAILEDAGAQSVSNWATAISKGPGDESAQTLSFTTSNDNNDLFSVQPGVTPTGTLVYTPASDAYGSATVTATISDSGETANGGDDTSEPQTFTITVSPVNDVPVANDDADTTTEDATKDIDVRSNDTDADPGDVLAVSDLTNTDGDANDGALSLTGDGRVRYVPAGEFDHLQVGQSETDTFSYKISDANGGEDTATVTVTVTGVNDNPTATAKSHTAIGNTLLTVNDTSSAPHTETSANHLLVGVTDPDDTVFTASGPTTAQNGSDVTVDGDGSFTFLPAQGYTGNDSFTFTVTDDQGGAGTATATVAVSNMAWYVNAAAAGPGTGRSTDPFNSPAPLTTSGSADAKDGTGDHIFVYAGTYTGGLVLEGTQKLWGAPHGLTVAGTPLVAAGGSAPTIGGGVTLGSTADVQGVALGANSGAYALSGTNVGSATVGTVTAVSVNNPTGGGVSLNTGTPTVTLSSLTSGGGAGGLALATVNGPVTVNGGAISGFSGTGVSISGGTGTVTSAATVAAGAGARSVNVANHGAGPVTLSGTITDNGLGIHLDNNDASTVQLTGALTLSTGSNAAFNAVNGGTVAAPHASNTASTTTGKAVNVTNTTIHSSGLKFANVASNGAVSGIVLDTTGSSGSLTVADGSILNSTSHGIDLNSTLSPSFTSVTITNSGGQGVEGNNLTNFTFVNGSIANSGTGGAAEASNIGLNTTGTGTEQNVTGIVTITGNTLSTARHHGIDIFNYAGTITDLNVSNNVVTSSTSAASSLGSGIRVHAFGGDGNVASVTKATISGNDIDNFPMGAGIVFQGGNASQTGPTGSVGTPGSATNRVTITGNFVDGDATTKMGTNGILVTMNGKGSAHYVVTNNGSAGNPMNNIKGVMISGGVFGNAQATITVDGNHLVGDAAGFDPPGIGIGTSATWDVNDAPVANVTVTNNNVSGTEGQGILVTARDAHGTMNARIRNNVVAAPQTTGARQGIRVDSGNTTANSDESVCLDVAGNTSAGSISGAMGIGLRKQSTSTTVNTFGIVGMSATATPGVEAYVDSLNPAGGGTLLVSAASGFSSCTLPF